MCREVLCNPEVMTSLESCVVWATFSSSPSASLILRGMRVAELPFIALVFSDSRQQPVLYGELAGYTAPQVVIEAVAMAQQEVTANGPAATQHRNAIDREILQEQNREYEEVKARDLEEKRKRTEALEKATEEETKKRLAEEEERRKKEEKQSRLRKLYTEDFENQTELSPSDTTTIIRAKFPDGSAMQRVFEGSEKVQRLKDWVEVAPLLHPDRNLVVPARFSLSLAYPSRTLEEWDATLAGSGLCPNAILYVQPLADEAVDGPRDSTGGSSGSSSSSSGSSNSGSGEAITKT
eukprot:Filipodium_phascolosomae@DN3642_c0_g1_i1.p1